MLIQNDRDGISKMKFSTGDLVQLKSGGPVMTVEGHINIDVDVVWFVGTKYTSNSFKPDMLEMATKPIITVRAEKQSKKLITKTEDAVLI